MKKVTIVFDKRLQGLLTGDDDFKQSPLLGYAMAVTNFVVETAATGILHPPQFPVLNGDFEVPEAIRLTKSELGLFTEAYRMAGRIESYIQPGRTSPCLGIETRFYSKGRGHTLILQINATVDSMAARRFSVGPLILPELQPLYERGKQERKARESAESLNRMLNRFGP